ncbi:MAG: DUF2318 domain-containing protein [Eggerthellaceae bacterium]|nr:DUF2318 domain-containing protein [Eggerthellaceae bacterium]
MEIYFANVVEDLIVTALLVGVVFAYARDSQGRFSMKVVLGGIIVGVVASVVMAIMKQNTALIATGDWNMGIFVVSLVVAVVALVCAILARIVGKGGKDAASEQTGGASSVMRIIVLFAFTLFMALRIFYMLPDVINYPANFGISADNLISTDFAYRIIGYLAGIVVAVVACVAVAKAYKALNHRMMGLATGIVIAIICVVQTVSLVQIFIARRIIKAGTDLYSAAFSVTTWTSNNAVVFTMLILLVFAVLSIYVIVLSLRDDEPYANPAEHRKLRAKWRNRRRWAICVLVCILISMLTVTVVKDYANRGPELSPSEECEVHDGNVYVSLEQVADGHLHRFTYMTEAGVELENGKTTQGGVGVRFIVIKKPGSSAYGIGLDACEICGETGYYERDGQVVCKLCDVVMNINTIGFKGGCNPIPVEYSIADGYIVFPTDGLSQYEKTFK